MKRLWFIFVPVGIVIAAFALPSTPVPEAAPRPIYVTNVLVIYPKATNWVFVNVTNQFFGMIPSMTVSNLYISKIVTNK